MRLKKVVAKDIKAGMRLRLPYYGNLVPATVMSSAFSERSGRVHCEYVADADIYLSANGKIQSRQSLCHMKPDSVYAETKAKKPTKSSL